MSSEVIERVRREVGEKVETRRGAWLAGVLFIVLFWMAVGVVVHQTLILPLIHGS